MMREDERGNLRAPVDLISFPGLKLSPCPEALSQLGKMGTMSACHLQRDASVCLFLAG